MSAFRRRGPGRAARRLHTDESGFSLPEVIVSVAISAMVMGAVSTTIFTTNDLQRRAADRNRIAGALAVIALDLDRDGAMAAGNAPALSQTSSTSCANTIDLGFIESGGTVRYRTAAAAAPDGPLVLQRVSGAGSRNIARNLSGCTWQSERDAGGRWTLRLDVTLTGPAGETISQTVLAAPRLW
jgi:prepilin-type N-terminal cleavage/methylation domain-containing protein